MFKRILLLGGEGFIGRNIAEKMSDYYGCYSIGTEKSVFQKREDEFIQADPYKEKIINNYDVIIHLIDNRVDLKKFIKKEEKLIENISLNRKNHLIIFSSAVVYANPNSEYGQRKLALEEIYGNYCRKNEINLTILRLFNIFGPYQLPQRQGSLIANIFCNYLNGKNTSIKDMEAKRDFIFSNDMARLVEYAIKNEVNGTYDLASGKLISIREMIILMEEIIGKNIKLDDAKEKENIESPEGAGLLVDKIKPIPSKEGLRVIFNFYKNNLELINRISK